MFLVVVDKHGATIDVSNDWTATRKRQYLMGGHAYYALSAVQCQRIRDHARAELDAGSLLLRPTEQAVHESGELLGIKLHFRGDLEEPEQRERREAEELLQRRKEEMERIEAEREARKRTVTNVSRHTITVPVSYGSDEAYVLEPCTSYRADPEHLIEVHRLGRDALEAGFLHFTKESPSREEVLAWALALPLVDRPEDPNFSIALEELLSPKEQARRTREAEKAEQDARCEQMRLEALAQIAERLRAEKALAAREAAKAEREREKQRTIDAEAAEVERARRDAEERMLAERWATVEATILAEEQLERERMTAVESVETEAA